MYVLWFDLRKVCMCAYFPNTIEPCRKSIRDGELIRTFENWYTQRSFVLCDMYHILMVTKVKYGRIVRIMLCFPNKHFDILFLIS